MTDTNYSSRQVSALEEGVGGITKQMSASQALELALQFITAIRDQKKKQIRASGN
ncbi:MAG: hypothetical protein PHD43_18505 [Methylococcales bacterium]|nr:hypothetical protein [Methylococcales bacterium]